MTTAPSLGAVLYWVPGDNRLTLFAHHGASEQGLLWFIKIFISGAPLKKILYFIVFIDISGAPKTNRTSDLPLRRGLLYPLSYRGVARILPNGAWINERSQTHPAGRRPVYDAT